MQDRYKTFQERHRKFNDWENEYIRTLPMNERLKQFRILFEAVSEISKDKVQMVHREHLNGLIDVKKRLRVGMK